MAAYVTVLLAVGIRVNGGDVVLNKELNLVFELDTIKKNFHSVVASEVRRKKNSVTAIRVVENFEFAMADRKFRGDTEKTLGGKVLGVNNQSRNFGSKMCASCQRPNACI
eukprot:Colp12_sorted_trinity150504_noHs@30924